MPNYGLVINSRFRPFSYQEMLAPVQQSTEAHQALENAYEELNTNASIWEGLANKESDPITYQRYKNYADALKTQADELAANGLNPTSKQAVSNLRARYASDIIPIKNAYEKRQADIKAQQEALLKDPTHFFDRKANEVSLDEYLTNDKLDVLSDQYSGALLTQQVGQAAQTLKNTLTNKGALSKLGLPYQYERMLQYGASADDVLKAMSKDPQAAPILTKLVDDVMAASGIRNWSSMNGDWANNDMYRRAEAYAMQGLYNAIGTSKIDNFTDSYSQNIALQENKARLDREGTKTESTSSIRPIPLRAKQKLSKENEMLNSYIKKGWISRDETGYLRLTPEGKKAMYNKKASTGQSGNIRMINGKNMYTTPGAQIFMNQGLPTEYSLEPTKFGTFIESMYGSLADIDKDTGKITYKAHKDNKAINDYAESIKEGSFDIYRSSELGVTLDSAYQDEVTNAIKNSASMDKDGNLYLTPVSFAGKEGFKDKKSINVADLENYKITEFRPSQYGLTAMMSDGKNIIRVRIPADVSKEELKSIQQTMAAADQYSVYANDPRIPEANRLKYAQYAEAAYNQVQNATAGLVETFKSKVNEVE